MELTMTLPTSIKARPGQFARFSALGHFLRVEDRPTNGLGFVFQVQSDGSLQRVLGL